MITSIARSKKLVDVSATKGPKMPMHRAYIARHYFDPERLAKRALTEFALAMHSGRMIAFTGSWSAQESRDPPYPKWQKFLNAYALKAKRLVRSSPDSAAKRAIESAVSALKQLKNTDDALATLSVIEYALEYSSTVGTAELKELRQFGARLFHLGTKSAGTTNAAALVQGLGIERIITINYDLELEWELMTTWEEKHLYGAHRADAFSRQGEKRILPCLVAYDHDTRSFARTLPSGRAIVSDVFWQERTDRLIEFAVGSPDQDAHILHLHGRMTDPDTMIISQRDYNKQYRRSGVARLPFEHALRMLFAGNPILFVGVGMDERDVTATLEQFVSDHPNRRISPAFILWNADSNSRLKNDLRFRWLHRFGVLTLFDDEVRGISAKNLHKWDPDGLQRLSASIPAVAEKAESKLRPFEWYTSDLRSIQAKLANNPSHVDIWRPVHPVGSRRFNAATIRKYANSRYPITVCVAEPGTGKGAFARAVRKAWHKANPGGRSCVINASFVFETDSMFSLISGLGNSKIAAEEKQSRAQALIKYFSALGSSSAAGGTASAAPTAPLRQLLVVINGMERFLSPNGAPLTSELDALVRKLGQVADHLQDPAVSSVGSSLTSPGPTTVAVASSQASLLPLRIFVFGTARVRRYLKALQGGLASHIEFHDAATDPELRRPNKLGSVYLQAVTDRFAASRLCFTDLEPSQRTLIEQKQSGDRGGTRRAVLSAYLTAESLRKAGARAPDLCLDILTVMAFIGQPVENAVIAHAPRVQARLPDIASATPSLRARARDDFEQAIEKLVELGLLIEVMPFEGSPVHWKRYGLHRAVLAELRDRHGVPLSDSQLSSAFNLSIFAAQPADGYSPEGDIHQELSDLADRLIGAHKDPPLGPERDIEDEGLAPRWKASKVRRTIFLRATKSRRAWPHVSASLRAALALMRGYYSTSALLTLDRTDRSSVRETDGPLTEHAERIERLLKAGSANARDRRQFSLRAKRLSEWLGPAPFYADDLVWLQNELGVVKLAQGDLYGARRAFEEALRLNREHVEFEDHAQNWRRITLNQVHVDIERGALDRAESRLEQIEEAIANATQLSGNDVREKVVSWYAENIAQETNVVHPEVEHDVVLTVAMIYGYRALSLHLRGHLQSSKASFSHCTSILQKIGELRAYAMFQRHYASLLAVTGDRSGVAEALRLSIASAEATRQADLAYLTRISQAQHTYPHATAAERPVLLRLLQAALHYAEAGDMHRVRVEAGLNLATIKQASGDLDAALEHAADAMATATRYGLSLRKISLRILIGQILTKRGDPDSGRALLERAIRNADRVNYQRAVETAQNVLLKETSLGGYAAAPAGEKLIG